MEQMKVSEIISEIKEASAHQKSQSLVDEIRLMRAELNDPTFKVSIFDKKKGCVGERCPREEAVKFIGNIASELTGLDKKASLELANNYQFSKKDAIFFLNMNRDFTQSYLKAGRKLNLVQSEDCEASVFLKPTISRTKIVPSKNGTITTVVPACNKLVARSRVPKYMK